VTEKKDSLRGSVFGSVPTTKKKKKKKKKKPNWPGRRGTQGKALKKKKPKTTRGRLEAMQGAP